MEAGAGRETVWFQLGREHWNDLGVLKALLEECDTKEEKQALLKGVISMHEED